MKILIVEDDFISRRILQKILSKYGECDVAVDGKEAVTAFKLGWQDGTPYQLVCLDILMPEMNGHEVLTALRSFETEQGVLNTNQRSHIVMTTGCEDRQNFMTALRAGCEGFIPKPLDPARLIKTLRDIGALPEQEVK